MQHVNKKPTLNSVISSNWTRLFIGTAIGLWLLSYTIDKVNWVLFWVFFRNINWPILILAVIATSLYLLVKSWRWKILLDQRLSLSFKTVWRSSVIGAMFNILLPYLGEAVRALRVNQGQEKRFIFATVGIEKILDFTFLSLVVYGLSYLVALPSWFKNGLNISVVVLVVSAVTILMAKSLRTHLPRQLTEILSDLLVDKKTLGKAFLVTVLSWLTLTLVYYLSAISLGIALNPWSYLLVVSLLYIGLSIPSSPGYIGSYQFLIWIGLSFFGIDKELALVYSLVTLFVLSAPTAVLGWYYLVRD